MTTTPEPSPSRRSPRSTTSPARKTTARRTTAPATKTTTAKATTARTAPAKKTTAASTTAAPTKKTTAAPTKRTATKTAAPARTKAPAAKTAPAPTPARARRRRPTPDAIVERVIANAKKVAKKEAKAEAIRRGKSKAKRAKQVAKAVKGTHSFSEALRAQDGFVLADLDPRSTPNFEGDKTEAEAQLLALAERAAELQERLFAESRAGGSRAVLLVVQGMDTSGKGGIMRHVVGAVDPQGVAITAFKAPTAQERRHPFLWRIRNALPTPGQIGVFDRSHYEDVLIGKVRQLAPAATISRRYGQINTFEANVVADGTTIIKVMLHIGADEQKERLAERLERSDKHWKYNPGDIDERARWDEYQDAYQTAIEKTSTDHAPWFVVPADRKWYARLAVMNLLVEHLEALDPQWPTADFDVEEEKKRLAAT